MISKLCLAIGRENSDALNELHKLKSHYKWQISDYKCLFNFGNFGEENNVASED